MSQYTTTKLCCGKKTQTHSRVCIEHVVTGQSTSHSLVLCSKLINRLLSSVLNFDSLWEALFHFKPDLSQLRTFGCTCYILLRPYNKHKLQFRTTPCLFSGYPSDTKGCICFDPNTLRKFTYLNMFYLMKFISLHLPLQLLLPLSLLNHGFLLSFTGIYVLLLFITLLLPIMLPHHFPLLPHQNLSLLLLQNQLLICKISFTLLLFLHQMFFQSPLLLFLFLIFTLCKLDLRVALPNLIRSGAIKPLLSIIL